MNGINANPIHEFHPFLNGGFHLHPLYHPLNNRPFFFAQPILGIQLTVDIGNEFPPALAGG